MSKDIGRVGAKVLLNKSEKKRESVEFGQVNSIEILRGVLKRLAEEKNYNKAEDILFNELENKTSEELCNVAAEFYNLLLEKSDDDLKGGNFSKEEAQQGLEDIKRFKK
ncbi:DUF6483 family protein [Clostridium sp.]|uniref:DUF6483 family protein n=1 Tax=Clostridium sp. TaxID=1506 RepID=UPI003464E094